MEHTLGEEEVQALVEDRLISPKANDGKRKVSAAFLSPPSSGTPSIGSSSSGPSTSVRLRIFNALESSIELPEEIESVATLEYLGFTRKVSGEILQNFLARPNPDMNPDTLLNFALGQVSRLNSASLRDMPALEAMTAIGITAELQNILTDEMFRQVWLSQTPNFWLRNTMITRYNTFINLKDRLKKHAIIALKNKHEKKRAKVAGLFESDTSPAPQPPTATLNMITSTPDQHNLPEAHVMVAEPQPILPDHVALYKGKSPDDSEMNSSFILEDGRVNMTAISTRAGGDFNHKVEAWYWTPDEATAELYRQYAARRCSWGDTWIIRVQVHKSFLETLRIEELFFSQDWKTYVWYCRKAADDPPSRFDKFWKPRQAQLVKGHICGKAPDQVPRIAKENIQTSLSEDSLLITNGKKAVQWVFMDRDTADRMAEEIRGKVFIDVHPPVIPPFIPVETAGETSN